MYYVLGTTEALFDYLYIIVCFVVQLLSTPEFPSSIKSQRSLVYYYLLSGGYSEPPHYTTVGQCCMFQICKNDSVKCQLP